MANSTRFALVKEITEGNFGIAIAFWLPGFVLLWGLSYSQSDIAVWLATTNGNGQTVGGFLFATLASLALGMFISAIRWLVIDQLHGLTGLKRPNFDFANMTDAKTAAFQGVIQNHYRYYQYYANTLIAVMAAFLAYVVAKPVAQWPLWIAVASMLIALFLASRNALALYYDRAKQILGEKTT